MSDLGKRLLVGPCPLAASSSARPCCPSASRCRCSPPTRCRPTRTPPRRSCSSSRSAAPRSTRSRPVGRRHGRGRLLRRRRLVPAERARLPERRRRLRGRHHQPRAAGRRVRGVSALLVDYVLTVAVSISSAVANVASAVPGDRRRTRWRGPSASSSLITLMNLRGVRESGSAFAIPTYGFILEHLRDGRLRALPDRAGRRAAGRERRAGRSSPRAPSPGLALVFLIARAFSSGTTALTGIEAISNGVPAFRKPKSKNAATTLLLLGRDRDVDVRLDHLARALHRREGDREERRPHRPAGGPGRRRPSSCRSPRRSSATSSSARSCVTVDDGADPGAGGQHGVQRLPGARARSWPATATCPASCTPAATGWPSATASSCSPGWRSCWWSSTRPTSPP